MTHAMSDFGARLREARERRGIVLKEISEHTKISMTALEALERSDVSRLPGGIFARSFVRSYAAEIGLDPDKTLREFLERFGDDERFSVMPAGQGPLESSPSPQLAGTVLKIVVVSLVAMAIILYWTLSRHTADQSTAPRSDSAGRTSRRLLTTPALPKLPRLP